MRFLAICLVLLGLPLASRACDLALLLAVDVSGSVDPNEYRIQMDGLSAALRDPVIGEALVARQARLMLVQWTGSTRQNVTVPWTKITSFEALDGFANRITSSARAWRNFSTAIGEALEFSLLQFPSAPVCDRRMIDLSGDGASNEGVEPRDIHSALSRAGIIVNGLAIEASETNLTDYFFENLLVGEGAFVVTASTFEDYPQQIRIKLLREVTQQSALMRPVDNSAPQRSPLSRK
ncbi:MAG: DUF1194 domain-containing protein [Pseudomonadota bacterium]